MWLHVLHNCTGTLGGYPERSVQVQCSTDCHSIPIVERLWGEILNPISIRLFGLFQSNLHLHFTSIRESNMLYIWKYRCKQLVESVAVEPV